MYSRNIFLLKCFVLIYIPILFSLIFFRFSKLFKNLCIAMFIKNGNHIYHNFRNGFFVIEILKVLIRRRNNKIFSVIKHFRETLYTLVNFFRKYYCKKKINFKHTRNIGKVMKIGITLRLIKIWNCIPHNTSCILLKVLLCKYSDNWCDYDCCNNETPHIGFFSLSSH